MQFKAYEQPILELRRIESAQSYATIENYLSVNEDTGEDIY